MSIDISKVAVIGVGTMGAAVGQHFLMKGLPLLLVDINQTNLDKGRTSIDRSLHEAVQRRILSEQVKTELMGNLSCSTDFSDLSETDLVVEAVSTTLSTVPRGLERNLRLNSELR